jgi:hypothetical protein
MPFSYEIVSLTLPTKWATCPVISVGGQAAQTYCHPELKLKIKFAHCENEKDNLSLALHNLIVNRINLILSSQPQ